MTEEWKENFMEALYRRVGEITEQNRLTESRDGETVLKSLFLVYEGQEKGVMAVASLFETLPEIAQLEINFVLDQDIDLQYAKELEHAMVEMNYYLPIGAAGIEYSKNKIALRQVLVLDQKKSLETLVAETIQIYELMMISVRIVYPAFTQIGTGALTYRQAVEQKLLLEQE